MPGRQPVREALRAGRALSEVVIDRRGGTVLAALADAAAVAGVAVRRVDAAALDQLAGGVAHQGVVALAPPYSYAALVDVVDSDLVVVLDGVTDPHNLGAIARSAEAAGAGALVVRERRGAPVTPAAEKAAAGALSWLPVVRVGNIVRTLTDLAGAGFWSAGLSADGPESVWDSSVLDGRVALVVGSEGAGLSRLVAERVDVRVAIPLRGSLDSLNAGAAAAVALFEILRRRQSGADVAANS